LIKKFLDLENDKKKLSVELSDLNLLFESKTAELNFLKKDFEFK